MLEKEVKPGIASCAHQMVFDSKEMIMRTCVRCTKCGREEIHIEKQR